MASRGMWGGVHWLNKKFAEYVVERSKMKDGRNTVLFASRKTGLNTLGSIITGTIRLTGGNGITGITGKLVHGILAQECGEHLRGNLILKRKNWRLKGSLRVL